VSGDCAAMPTDQRERVLSGGADARRHPEFTAANTRRHQRGKRGQRTPHGGHGGKGSVLQMAELKGVMTNARQPESRRPEGTCHDDLSGNGWTVQDEVDGGEREYTEGRDLDHSGNHVDDDGYLESSGPLAPGSSPVYRGRYILQPDFRLGSTRLFLAYDTGVVPTVTLSAIQVENEEYDHFLKTVGKVLVTFRRNPHPNLPTTVAALDPNPATNSPGCLLLNGYYGDLYTDSRCQPDPPVRRTLPYLLRILRQMTAAVAHCHRNSVCHGGIKIGKFMFADKERQMIQLADLCGAQMLPSGQRHIRRPACSPAYICPEALDGPVYDGFAADVWALGVAAHFLILSEYPFEGKTPRDLFPLIQAGKLTKLPPTLPSSIADLLHQMLHVDPSCRITAIDALSHPALTVNQYPSHSAAPVDTSLQNSPLYQSLKAEQISRPETTCMVLPDLVPMTEPVRTKRVFSEVECDAAEEDVHSVETNTHNMDPPAKRRGSLLWRAKKHVV